MKSLYIIGGQQEANATNLDGWAPYRKGIILKVNTETGNAEICMEYVSPPATCAEGGGILFKSSSIQDNKLFVCTETEVCIYEIPKFEKIGYISLPCFNDVHHVKPTPEGNLLIANTGLDMVLEVTHQGKILREWNVLGEEPWSLFSKEVDYRKVASTKPHKSHPNHVFQINQDVWVTRFEQRDAICLTNSNQRIEIGIERPHDGIVDDKEIYFTTIDGHVVIVDRDKLKIKEIVNLNEINPTEGLLGWCRSIMINERKGWVGFSRIRQTKLKENLSWIKKGFKKVEPTKISYYDFEKKEFIREINLEDWGVNAVFSILADPQASGL